MSNPNDHNEYHSEAREEVATATEKKLKRPKLYKVLIHNDDYTTMEFVVIVLESVFHRSPAEAYRIMLKVHSQGQGLCGIYPYDVAETRSLMAQDLARHEGFPLQTSLEKE